MGRYWVVGGEYRDTGFVEPAGGSEQRLGPFADYDAAKAFYGTVFGWPFEVVSDTPEFRYCTNGPTDDATSGMIDASAWLPDDVPSHWTVYLGVDDAEAANAKAVELGATILQGPDDSPYGILTVLADPNGAIFRLHQPGGAA